MTRVSRRVRIGVSVLVLAAASILIWPLQALAGDYSFSFYLSEQDVVIDGSSGAPRIIVKNTGFHLLADEGMPALPVRTVNILLPQGEVVQDFSFGSSGFSVVSKNFNPSMAPSPISEDGIKGSGQSLFPGSDPGSAFPPALGRYLGTGYYRGFALASFLIAPIQYDKGAVKLRGEITLSIKTGFPEAAADIASRERFREGFGEKTARELASLVVNPSIINTYVFDEVRVPRPKGGFNPSSAPSLEGSPVDCIIITADSLKSAYQRFADFKTAKGVPTVVKTLEWIQANYRNGVDIQETIRFFIRDAYQKWGISWVLLGGDTDIIPARYAFNRFYENGTLVPTDMYFACLDGSWNDTHDAYWGEGFYYVLLDNPDLYAEVYLGRLPTSNVGDVNNMVNKIISYETPVNRDYTDEAELLAEVLFPVDWKEGQPMTLNGADLAEYLYSITLQGGPLDVTRSYETYSLFTGAVPESRQATIDSMNAGKNIIQHIGHGFRFNMSVADASVMNSDADALTNIDRYFLLYMLNCTAGAFDYYCLAEHYLRNTAGGAMAIIASNRSAFPNASSYYMNDFYDLLLNQDISHIGEAFAKSRLNRTPIAEAGDNVDLWTHYIYTLLADPEMPLWTAQVDTLNVFHIANVGLGENTILVNVTASGLPVDTALVCLYKGQDDYQYAPTNTLGNATFNFTCEQPGSISVVVTGLNHARHQSYITVDPSGSGYVHFSSLAADDDSTGGSYGNGDAVINAGETVDLLMSAVNSGGSAADGVWCVLRSSDPQVTINDSIAYFGSLTASENKQAYDPLNVSFSGTIADETSIPFTLEFHDTLGSIWNDSFNKVVHAPVLDLLLLSVDDSAPLGNGNGVVEPNEEFLLFCEIKNYGTGAAAGLSAQLQDLSFNFVFIDSTDIYADISPMGSSNNTAGFHIKEAIVTIENDMELTITDIFGNVYLDTIELRIPDPPSNLMFDASKGADRIEVSWLKSITADVKKYNVYHSLTSGGPYDLISVDPVDHAVFMDVGLPSSTRYYYVVTAVDKSGNESVFSTEYYASTNPPQLTGWPIEMLDYTASSPAVGDIDGDGDKEVITGNKYVYAWHHNGVEMRDGDGDPQTWGILCTTGTDFVAPVALAKIDSVMGLDIVAVSYTTLSVYCFDYQGNTLAGWPQTTETNVRATPVIADLDGDSDPEIIVVDQAGVLYAWNSDGTEYRDGDSNPATQGVFHRTPTAASWHYQAPAVCDLDKDNMDEIILGTTVDTIYAFNGDGTQVPGWPVSATGDIAGSVVAGDIDLDGDIEIVATTKSPGVMVLNPDGTAQAGWPKWMPSYTGFNPSPALADITGNGYLEIIAAGSNDKLYAFRYDGSTLSGWPFNYSTTYTESSPVVADVDGDGGMDVILGDESKYINAWNAGGNLIDGFPIAVQDAIRGTPALDDLDGDGDIELVLACWDKSLYVWDFPSAYDKNLADWPTFHGNVHRNGLHGFEVPTALGQVVFSFRIIRKSVELTWAFPPGSGYEFDILRKDNPDGSPSGYFRIAAGLRPDDSGELRFFDQDLDPGMKYSYRIAAVGGEGDYETGAIYVPISRAELMQNYPNPFNPRTMIVFFVPEGASQKVSLKIYNVQGALVKTLIDGVLKPDKYEYSWDGSNNHGQPVASGVYFYQLREKNYAETKKMILLK